jgi:hypothetical protein
MHHWSLVRVSLPILVLFHLSLALHAQQTTAPAAPTPTPAPTPSIVRFDGVDQSSGIHYLRLYIDGTLIQPPTPAPPPSPPPALIAQCTRSASGKLTFELLANFGGVTDTTYYPPWHPSKGDLYPPKLQKPNLTMEFLGYTHVKPVKRQWEALLVPQGQYRYNTPSGDSNNMENSTFYLRYLLALPTLHLTLDRQTAEFKTTPLLDQIRKEPLCAASLLPPIPSPSH